MKCQILFSGKNKKNISKCRLLKILPRVLSIKLPVTIAADTKILYILLRKQDLTSAMQTIHMKVSSL